MRGDESPNFTDGQKPKGEEWATTAAAVLLDGLHDHRSETACMMRHHDASLFRWSSFCRKARKKSSTLTLSTCIEHNRPLNFWSSVLFCTFP